MKRAALKTLQRLQHRAVVLTHQPFGYVEPEVRIDPDQVRVERRMVNFRKRDAIGNDWLAHFLVAVGNDVGGIEQQWFR